jgi:hypothetical protein
MIAVTRIQPKKGTYHAELARFYLDQGDLDHAASSAKKAAELRGGEDGYRILARIAEKRKDLKSAVSAYKRWLILARHGDKTNVRRKVEILIRRSPPVRKVSHAACKYTEDCPGLELCEEGTCE